MVSLISNLMISETIYLHYLNALLDYDKKQCARIVTNLLEEKVPVKEIYLNLFQRSMYRIGQMWEKERCSIVDEHLAAKITESLIELTVSLSHPIENVNKNVVITCTDKEYHQLGAKMVAAFFEVQGWDTLYIGSAIPLNGILYLLHKKHFDVVGISVNFYMNLTRLSKLISLIKEDLPEQKIIIGGQALENINLEKIITYDDVKYISSLKELDEFIKQETYSNF